MFSTADLTPAALLAAEESGVLERRRAEVEAMERLLAWCDLHAGDPQDQPGAVPVRFGGNRLVRLGGDGTPAVAELCLAEFAIAAHAGVIATTHRAADVLDLRHRLPLVYAATHALDVEVWVARKVAALTRRLTRHQAAVVDAAVAAAGHEAAGRILAIAEAKVIEADPEAHRAKIAAEEARQGVWLRRRRTGQAVDPVAGAALGADVQAIAMNLSTAGAEALHETITHLAEQLAAQHAPEGEDDIPTADQFRAHAAELLADPAAVLRLLDHDGPSIKPPRRRAQLVVHLHADVLAGDVDGVARTEGIGPLLLEQVQALLQDLEVTVLPVIDLSVGRAVNGYEHPTRVKQRTLLRTTRDVFPHSGRISTALLDHDHATPYVPPDEGGPPGQTGDHNDAPLGRRDHRAKTHLGYRVSQLGLGAYRWETPHGLGRIVTGKGTQRVELLRDDNGVVRGELCPMPFSIEIDRLPGPRQRPSRRERRPSR